MSSSTIDDHGNNSSGRDQESSMDGDDDGGGSAIDGDEGDNLENGNEFSADKELLFQQRHEEGYDLYDPEYVRWLEVYHPDDVPHDRYHLVPSMSNSIVESFATVIPLSPMTLSSPESGPTVMSEFR